MRNDEVCSRLCFFSKKKQTWNVFDLGAAADACLVAWDLWGSCIPLPSKTESPYIQVSHSLFTQAGEMISHVMFSTVLGYMCFSVVVCRVGWIQAGSLKFKPGFHCPQQVLLWLNCRGIKETLGETCPMLRVWRFQHTPGWVFCG